MTLIPAKITQDPLTQHQGESFGPNRIAWRISLRCSDSISSPRTGVEAILTELGPGNQNRRYAASSHSSVGPFGYACAPLYASEHVKQRTLGQEPKGRRSILTSHLVHRLPRKQRTRALTRSNLTVCLIQTRLPDSIAKRECSAGSAEGPRSKIQRNVRIVNDTSFRKATTGKTTAWNLPDRRF